MTETSGADILTELRDRIFTIRLDRPARKNAITAAMYRAMADALSEAAESPAVRCLLFAGAPGFFSSGNDLEDFLERPPEAGGEAPVWRFLDALVHQPKPVVAAVNGPAIGIGTTLLLHCDLVVAGDNALFQMPFVNIGVCPEAGSSFLIPRLVGHHKAAELLLLCERFDAAAAVQMGIANRVVAAAETEAVARELALRLAAQPPAALRTTKRLMKQSITGQLAATMAEEPPAFAGLLAGEEAREAMTAFLQKRRPDFSRFN